MIQPFHFSIRLRVAWRCWLPDNPIALKVGHKFIRIELASIIYSDEPRGAVGPYDLLHQFLYSFCQPFDQGNRQGCAGAIVSRREEVVAKMYFIQWADEVDFSELEGINSGVRMNCRRFSCI